MADKISSLEYKLREILSGYGDEDLTEGFAPRSALEEDQAENEKLREQLSTFKQSNGDSIDPRLIDSLAGKAH